MHDIKKLIKSRCSFTLLELLVVIGIISILLTFGMVSYSTAQKKARDSKRKDDLKQIQNAMEQCYTVNNYQYIIPTFDGTLTCNNTTIKYPTADPLGGTHKYECVGTCDATTYTICSSQVRTSDNSRMESETCLGASGVASNCCITNLQ